MVKTNYFLIARNRDNFDDNCIVKINRHFIHKLEEIDLFTMNYYNSESLTNDLVRKKIISGNNYDYFIAGRKEIEGESYIEFLGVLFSDAKNYHLDRIAKSYVENNESTTQNYRDGILDSFSLKIGTDNDYYEKSIFECYNIYPKYLQYFHNKRYSVIYEAKYKNGGWARKSYKLSRNIVESFIRYEKERYMSTEYLVDGLSRDFAKQKLLVLTEPERLPYNGDLFSIADED